MTRICPVTVGCRLAACETEALAGRIARERGGALCTDPAGADLVVLGTCCVTERSRAGSRKSARRVLRESGGDVIVTGCSARLFPQDFEAGERLTVEPDRGITPRPDATPPSPGRTRAMLKVQDGCDKHCSFCIVPRARGRSRSVPREDVLRAAEELSCAGFREIVLTGVDTVSYGGDLYRDGYGLADLACAVAETGARVRLASLDPAGLSCGLLGRLAAPWLCRHLHVSVQSGSPRVLEAMGRGDGGDVRGVLRMARRMIPGAMIGADLLTGFPGETDGEFDETLSLFEEGLLDYAHVFPFSPRPGTRAERMGDRVPGGTARRRASALRAASRRRRTAARMARAGMLLDVIVEDRMKDGRLVGISDDYVPVLAPAGAGPGDRIGFRPSPGDIIVDEDPGWPC